MPDAGWWHVLRRLYTTIEAPWVCSLQFVKLGFDAALADVADNGLAGVVLVLLNSMLQVPELFLARRRLGLGSRLRALHNRRERVSQRPPARPTPVLTSHSAR